MPLDKRKSKQKRTDSYLKILVNIMYLYFVVVLLLLIGVLPFVMDLKPYDFAKYFGVNSWLIIISILGIIFTYKLSKLERWALIALMIIIGLEAFVILIVSIYLKEGFTLPIIPLALLIMLAIGLEHFKNEN